MVDNSAVHETLIMSDVYRVRYSPHDKCAKSVNGIHEIFSAENNLIHDV